MFSFPKTPNPGDPYDEPRTRMIEDHLRARGIVMHRVLEAMREVPRHLFVSHEFAHRAYADEALPSAEGQTISQPYMVAVMTQELDIHPGMSVLEIGTGTGYQTAVLSVMVKPEGKVYTVESVGKLAESARRRLEGMGYQNTRFCVGDGTFGWPKSLWDEPGDPCFDRILVTAAAPSLPNPLINQLKTGGILLIPLGDTQEQTLVKIKKTPQGLEQSNLLACRFVPLIGQHAWDIQAYRRLREHL